MESVSEFIRSRRSKLGLTQQDIADRAGVGLRLVRDLEQERKLGFRLDKVNQILALFGHQLGPVQKGKKN